MKWLNNFLLLLCCATHHFSVSAISNMPFSTLNAAQDYASEARNPEYPKLRSGDWVNPDFTKFYKSQKVAWWKRLYKNITFEKSVVWNIQQFKTLLLEQTRQRQLNGLRGNFVQKINPTSKNKFIMWGDLHGAFHSLIRDLIELNRKGIIDQNFKIHQDYYFIMNGNSIDHSPYSIETLTLIMRIMQINPKKVIYIRGKHEDRQKWENHSLARELKVKAQSVSDELIPLSKELTDFFNTLPLALYICDLHADKVNVVQISCIDLDDTRLDLKKYKAFLAQKPTQDQPDIFKTDQKLNSKIPVILDAIISSEDRTVKYHPSKGLVLINRINKAPVWALLSSPIGMHRALYNYFYDSFVELTIRSDIHDWILTLFNQDVRQMLGFEKRAMYKLISGDRIINNQQLINKPIVTACQKEQHEIKELKTKFKKMEQEVKNLRTKTQEGHVKKEIKKEQNITQSVQMKNNKIKESKSGNNKKNNISEKKSANQRFKKVVFGSCTDLRSGSSEFVLFSRGLKLRFDAVRNQGGINNTIMPQLILKNDYFRPAKTREIVDGYISQGINKILAITGAGPTKSILDLVKEKKILLLFPSTGLPEARSAEYTNLVFYRTDDILEGKVIADYAVNTLHTQKGVLLVENDAFGKSLLLGIEPMLKKLGAIKNWTKIYHEPHKTKLDKQVEEIKKIKPDTIMFCGAISIAMAAIRQIGVDKLTKTKLIGNSDFSSETMQKFVKDKGLALINPVLVPNPKTSDLEIVKQFRKAADKGNVPYDVFALESYITADITFDILKKIKGKITNEKIMQVIEHIKDYEYKGLKLNFNPKNRQITQMMWLDEGDTENWKPVDLHKFI